MVDTKDFYGILARKRGNKERCSVRTRNLVQNPLGSNAREGSTPSWITNFPVLSPIWTLSDQRGLDCSPKDIRASTDSGVRVFPYVNPAGEWGWVLPRRDDRNLKTLASLGKKGGVLGYGVMVARLTLDEEDSVRIAISQLLFTFCIIELLLL